MVQKWQIKDGTPPTWWLWDHKQPTVKTRQTSIQNLLNCPFFNKGANFEVQLPPPVMGKKMKPDKRTEEENSPSIEVCTPIPLAPEAMGTTPAPA